jgi:hypothetical protein
MKRCFAGLALVALVLTGCDSYRALLFRDGPYDLANDKALQGGITVDSPFDVRFTYPVSLDYGAATIRWDVRDESTIYWAAIEGEGIEYELLYQEVTASSVDEWGALWDFDPDPLSSAETSGTIPVGADAGASLKIAALVERVPDAVDRLNRVFADDVAVDDEGLILAVRVKVDGIWTDPAQGVSSWETQPFLQELYGEVWGWE